MQWRVHRPERGRIAVMREAYYWLFYSLYRLDPFRADGFDRKLGTLGLATIIQICAVTSLLYGAGVLLESGFVFRIPRSVVAAATLVIFGLNYLATLRHDAWREYANRFEALPTRARRTRVFIAWIAAAVAIVMFLATSFAYRKSPVGVSARERAVEARERARTSGPTR